MESRHAQTVILKLVAAGGIFLLLFFLILRLIPAGPLPGASPLLLPSVPGFFTENLQHGDLLFREGKTLASEVARKASVKDRRFSHVGILIKEKSDFFVIHAIHDEKKGFHGVVRESLAGFLADGNHFGAYRISLEEAQLLEVTRKAKTLADLKIPYDHNYDLEDSGNLYCTEFIVHLLRDLPGAGSIGTTDFLGKQVVAVENIYENGEVFKVVF